jgi:hypothetical protein
LTDMVICKITRTRQKENSLAARKLSVKYGGENRTLIRIDEEIGVTESAIYCHFKSKGGILSYLADTALFSGANFLKT